MQPHEVYVRPFPGPGGKGQISTGCGLFPMWSRKGREPFYEALDNRIIVAEYKVAGDSFHPGKPRVWSDQPLASFGLVPNLDLAPDGKRFVVIPRVNAAGDGTGRFTSRFC